MHPHELGQNFLVDHAAVAAVLDLVTDALRPGDEIVEIGAGRGALTHPLGSLGPPVHAVEIDGGLAHRLHRATPAHVTVRAADALAVPLPGSSHVLVSNLPFHLTTALLRRFLAARGWHTAVLVAQWEVARRRAGVGGASLLTASWWPWYEFALHRRVPARAFRPVPAVDGGLFSVHRRPAPLVRDRPAYQQFVREVFTGRGRGVLDVVVRTGRAGRRDMARFAAEHGVRRAALPPELTAAQWAALWAVVVGRRDS